MLNLRSNKVLQQQYLDFLKADDLLYKVYREIDGTKSQNEIAATVGTTAMSVSRKIKKLLEEGLIEIKDVNAKGNIYMHSIAERAFKLIKVIG